MERSSKHHILSLNEQEKLSKEKIEDFLREHNLRENVDLIYLLMNEYNDMDYDNKMDLCIEKVVGIFTGQQQTLEENEAEEHANQYDIYTKT